MTKFKEYFMAHGAILECNSAELARDENWDVTLEYIDFMNFMLDMGYDKSAWALTVMRNTYVDHAKVRIAFKHMKAGIMDARAVYKLALRYRFF